ncbi:MAG: hypothetical protein A3C84_03145 [Candidatus Ryanbacteria bacterium RIFCSPHIGHO2_02_FULL_48_12]|uniref:Nudix hydrolase domain-containing protein n=1 Tax=Candidatus Ryanbacteria bacterium RIFCSPHIGHO2_01_FULL_48_27 TaxID=1802115 RepID=A0A1G2G7V6_9BACT|nr:MAG: hypothetical protein A2756_04445 [Candidatus Ryanbacteria bacterium RIFCSPHIGHO2_01_FULL_48_27]OGZ49645.1 MAG: hypothetical protein A3C84_03145 [Candidatus Ryanbacteria bacterium RIFCSPHIGHO2_02_FULL_48_12]
MRLLTVSFGVPLHVREDLDPRYTLGYTDAIEDILDRLGLPEKYKRPHMSEEEADQFRRAVWADSAWRKYASNVLERSFGCSLTLSDKDFEAISIPWWNELVRGCVFPVSGWYKWGAYYLPPVLDCLLPDQHVFTIGPRESVSMHSYAVMLQRKYSWLQGGSRAIGVAVLVRTKDGYFVLGRRAGDYESGKIAIVPAGSASYQMSELSARAELVEELGIDAGSISRFELAGAFEHDDSRLIYVYTTELILSREEVSQRWMTAPDAWEHSELLFLSLGGLASQKDEAIASLRDTNLSRFSLGAIAVGAAHLTQSVEWLIGVFGNEPEFLSFLYK